MRKHTVGLLPQAPPKSRHPGNPPPGGGGPFPEGLSLFHLARAHPQGKPLHTHTTQAQAGQAVSCSDSSSPRPHTKAPNKGPSLSALFFVMPAGLWRRGPGVRLLGQDTMGFSLLASMWESPSSFNQGVRAGEKRQASPVGGVQQLLVLNPSSLYVL